MFDLDDPKNAEMEQLLAAQFIKTWEELLLMILNNAHNVMRIFAEHKFSSDDCRSFLEGSLCSLVAHLTFEIARAISVPFATVTATVTEYFPMAETMRSNTVTSETSDKMH